jgi:hypothetical protein
MELLGVVLPWWVRKRDFLHGKWVWEWKGMDQKKVFPVSFGAFCGLIWSSCGIFAKWSIVIKRDTAFISSFC